MKQSPENWRELYTPQQTQADRDYWNSIAQQSASARQNINNMPWVFRATETGNPQVYGPDVMRNMVLGGAPAPGGQAAAPNPLTQVASPQSQSPLNGVSPDVIQGLLALLQQQGNQSPQPLGLPPTLGSDVGRR